MNFTLLSRTKLPFWEVLLILYLFAAYLVPSFSLGSTTLLLLLLFVYCAYMTFVDKELLPIVSISVGLMLLLSLFYALLTDMTTISADSSNREIKVFLSTLYQYLSLYFPAFLFFRINRVATKGQKKIFAIAGIVLMVYVIITTWTYLLENPDATRHWEDFNETSELNVANYTFVYAVPIIISAISIFMLKYRGVVRYLSLALVIVGIVFLVNAQYTLAILIAIIGVLIQVFRHIKTTLYKTLFVLAFLAIAVFLPQILTYAIGVIPSEQVTIRLDEIRAFLTGQGASGYNLSSRLTLYGKAIVAFLKSPVWGNRHLDFNGHATFLTVLADTGILGGVPFYALLISICRHMKKQLGAHQTQFGVIILMFVMMGLTNPIHASLPLGLTTWFLAPLAIQTFLKEEPSHV